MPDELSIQIPETIAWIYITTNFHKTVLYIGSTINLPQRLFEHYINQGLTNSFTSKYKAFTVFTMNHFTRKKMQEKENKK